MFRCEPGRRRPLRKSNHRRVCGPQRRACGNRVAGGRGSPPLREKAWLRDGGSRGRPPKGLRAGVEVRALRASRRRARLAAVTVGHVRAYGRRMRLPYGYRPPPHHAGTGNYEATIAGAVGRRNRGSHASLREGHAPPLRVPPGITATPYLFHVQMRAWPQATPAEEQPPASMWAAAAGVRQPGGGRAWEPAPTGESLAA